MKKSFFLLSFVAATLTANTVSAQENIFNHLAVGVEVGTTGYGFEVAAPCTDYVTFRTGFTTMPRIGVSTDINYTYNGADKNVDIKAKLNMTDFKLLADIYPFKKSSFHVTTGFYVGKSDLVTIHNEGDLGILPGEGIEIGNKLIIPDEDGIVHIKAKTNSFKPYLGLGFGRPISRKHKVSCAFDLGVQFWGKPGLYAYTEDDGDWTKYNKADVDDEDLNDAIDILEKISVYPVLNFRVYFNAF